MIVIVLAILLNISVAMRWNTNIFFMIGELFLLGILYLVISALFYFFTKKYKKGIIDFVLFIILCLLGSLTFVFI